MGGCKCHFRDCSVGHGRNPGMHYFNLHRKNSAEWLKLGGKDAKITEWPVKILKSRSFCARHFEDKYFMNYTKSKINSQAMPTLSRLTNTIVVDYANILKGGKPQIRELKPTNFAHMIPPSEFQDPTVLSEKEIEIGKQKLKNLLLSNEFENCLDMETMKQLKMDEVTNVVNNKEITHDANKEAVETVHAEQVPIKRFKLSVLEDELDIPMETMFSEELANTLRAELEEESSQQNMVNLDEYELSTNMSLENELITYSNQSVQVNMCEDFACSHKEEIEKLQQQQNINVNKIKNLTKLIKNDSVKFNTQLDEYKSKLQNQIQLNNDLKSANSLLESKNKQLEDNIKSLQQKLEQEQQKSQKSLEVPSTNVVISEASNSSQTTNNPTKAQLFNGIKKYLSSSMMSLLRMEMFGNSDRTWKPDEQRTAVDLLRLGENVYRYFIDEWRLRLPSMNETRNWLQQSTFDDNEEDL